MAQPPQITRYAPTNSGEKGDLLHSVQRALRVINLIAEAPQGLTAREVSSALDVNISTCYHILNTLVADGYLDRQPRQPIYLLGPQIPFLNNAFVRGLATQDAPGLELENMLPAGLLTPSLVSRLRPILYQLTEQTQEPSYLACWRYGEIVLQAIVEAPQAAKVTKLYVGYRGQAHCHALGKALLAFSEPAIVDAYLDTHPLAPFGPNTLVRHAAFIDELNAIARQGYSFDKEEFASETFCIAAPIFTSQGYVAAALGISLTADAFAKRTEWLITQVVRATNHARAILRVSPIPWS